MVAFLCPLPFTILPLTTDCLHHRPSQFLTPKEHIQFFAVKEFKDIRNATYGLELGSVDAPVIGQTAGDISETDAESTGGTTEPLAPRKVDIADFILASGVLVFSFWVSNYLVPDLVFRDTVFRDQVTPAPTNQTIEGEKASINVSKPGSGKSNTVFRDQVNPAPTNQTIEGEKASINVSNPGSGKGQRRGKV